MSQHRQYHASPFGDTTYTKIFVGGLAWETQRDTMRRYFEQFGEILEAVVIADKNTGRSKGYGFVTFKDPEAARRACVDPNPVIDGRRANCNLAAFGATASQRRPTRPASPQSGQGNLTASYAYNTSSSAPAAIGFYQQPQHYAFPPYSYYGYSGGYSQDGMYPMNYYRLSGGLAAAAAGTAVGGGGPSSGQHQLIPYYTGQTNPGFFYPYYAQYLQQSSHGGYQQQLQYQYLHQQPYSAGILALPPSNIVVTSGLPPPAAATTSAMDRNQPA